MIPKYNEWAYCLDCNDGAGVCSRDFANQLILPSGKFQRGPVESFALPFRSEPSDDNDGVSALGESNGILDGFILINLLTTSQALQS